MRRNLIIALVLSLSLSGCSTYQDVGGHTRFGDPAVCSATGSGFCMLMIVGLIAGCAAVAVNH